jgi:hypothetical protein
MHGSSCRTAAFMDAYGRFFETLTERLNLPILKRVAQE